jgi:hypothetical protein
MSTNAVGEVGVTAAGRPADLESGLSCTCSRRWNLWSRRSSTRSRDLCVAGLSDLSRPWQRPPCRELSPRIRLGERSLGRLLSTGQFRHWNRLRHYGAKFLPPPPPIVVVIFIRALLVVWPPVFRRAGVP